MTAHMKSHSLLSSQSIPLMQPIENRLQECFQTMRTGEIPENKNYFAMSLKLFFQSLKEDELEFLCHNYVHNWINEELQRSNRLLSKYQVESKLDYLKNNGGARTPRHPSVGGASARSRSALPTSVDQPGTVPRYMNPTIGKIKKQEDQFESEPVRLQDRLRKTPSATQNHAARQRSMTTLTKVWKPTGAPEPRQSAKSTAPDALNARAGGQVRPTSTTSRGQSQAKAADIVQRLHGGAEVKKQKRAQYEQQKVS